MSSRHTVPVIGQDGQPLTPTTPAKARKLIKGGQAKPFWTKFDSWAIRMVVPSRNEQPRCGLGVDHGHAHEGYAVVCGTENVLCVTLHLPDKRCYAEQGINARFYQGWETKTVRLEYGYPKSGDKKADRFSAQGSDALALAAHVSTGVRVEPGPLVIVDDRYRPVRRHLHDSNTGKGGKRIPYSRGTVHGLRKGLLIGTPKGKRGRLCGIYNNAYRYHDGSGKRQVTRTVVWVCTNYLTTTIASADEADASFLSVLKPRVP